MSKKYEKPIEHVSEKLTGWALLAAHTAWEAVEEVKDGVKNAVSASKTTTPPAA